jgi:hypothetical protein
MEHVEKQREEAVRLGREMEDLQVPLLPPSLVHISFEDWVFVHLVCIPACPKALCGALATESSALCRSHLQGCRCPVPPLLRLFDELSDEAPGGTLASRRVHARFFHICSGSWLKRRLTWSSWRARGNARAGRRSRSCPIQQMSCQSGESACIADILHALWQTETCHLKREC